MLPGAEPPGFGSASPHLRGRNAFGILFFCPRRRGFALLKPCRSGQGTQTAMKLFTEAFLDRWEARATAGQEQWQKKPDSRAKRWIMALHPDLRMQPTERYSLRRYLCKVAVTGLPVVFFISVVWLFPLAYSWWKYPFVFYDPRYHKPFIGLLSHEGFYIYPWMMLFLLAFNAVLYLPRFYFWNRQAERLRREPPPLPEAPGEATTADAGVWPPPPKRPAS